jgi:hypothetical protein
MSTRPIVATKLYGYDWWPALAQPGRRKYEVVADALAEAGTTLVLAQNQLDPGRQTRPTDQPAFHDPVNSSVRSHGRINRIMENRRALLAGAAAGAVLTARGTRCLGCARTAPTAAR